jgi:hypothetical protein
MKNGVFWDVTPCGSCETDVSEKLSASFIRVTRIGSPILVTLIKEALSSSETSVSQEPHGVTSQKTPFLRFKKFSFLKITLF